MHDRHPSPRRGRLLAASALLSLLITCPATAGKVNQTVSIFETLYTAKPGTTSNYLRVNIPSLPMNAVINASSYAYVITPAGVVTIVPVARVQAAQPNNMNKTSGFVDFEKAGYLFGTGDEVVVKIDTNGDTTGKLKASNGLFRTGIQNGVNGTDASFKVSGFQANFDPDLTLFNDLDPSVYADPTLAIRNLQFYTDLSPAGFDSLTDPSNLLALGDAPGDPGEPTALISDGSFDDLGPVLGQPAVGDWDAVSGQIYDPGTGQTLTAFVQGAQAAAVPDSSPLALLGLGLLPLGLLVRKRRPANKAESE